MIKKNPLPCVLIKKLLHLNFYAYKVTFSTPHIPRMNNHENIGSNDCVIFKYSRTEPKLEAEDILFLFTRK